MSNKHKSVRKQKKGLLEDKADRKAGFFMRRHRGNGLGKRALAVIMAFAMVFATFVESGITGYASNSVSANGIVEEEPEAVEDTVSGDSANPNEGSGDEIPDKGIPDEESGEVLPEDAEDTVSGNDGEEIDVNPNLFESTSVEPYAEEDSEGEEYVWIMERYGEEGEDVEALGGWNSFDELCTAINDLEESGGYLAIGYYPNREETPLSVIPKDMFVALEGKGVEQLDFVLHAEENAADGAVERCVWYFNGLYDTADYAGLSIDISYTKSGDSKLDEMFGAGHYIKMNAVGELPNFNYANVLVYDSGIRESFETDNNMYYQYQYTDGILTQVDWWDFGDNKDFVIFNLENPQPGAYVAVDGARAIFEGRIEQWSDTERALILDEWGMDSEDEMTKERALDILSLYKERGEIFQVVRVNFEDQKGKVIDKDVVNAAIEILDSEYEERRIEYQFDNEATCWSTYWNLNRPYQATENKSADAVMTILPGVGVKVKPTATGFSSEDVGLTIGYWGDDQGIIQSQLAEALGCVSTGEDEEGNIQYEGVDFGGFSLSSGNPAEKVDLNGYFDGSWAGLGFGNLNNVSGGKEYLLASYTELEPLNAGTTVSLAKMVEGMTGWKCISPKVASVTTSGELTLLNDGEVWLYAKNSAGKIKIFRAEVYRALEKIELNKKTLTMNLPREGEDWENRDYLRVKFYPSDADCDIEWSTSDASIVMLEENEEGRYDGSIKAVGEGTATITATPLNEEGNACGESVTCTVTVVAQPEDPDEWPEPYAITNINTKLGEVGLPEGWEWLEPATDLTPFKNMDMYSFNVRYTKDGKSTIHTIGVRMVTIQQVDIGTWEEEYDEEGQSTGKYITNIWHDISVPKGEEVLLGYRLSTNYGSKDEIDWIDWSQFQLQVSWNSKPAGTPSEDNELYSFNSPDKGKKTVNLEIKNKTTGAVIVKTSKNIQVTEKEYTDFWIDYITDEEEKPFIRVNIWNDKADYGFTCKVEDTSIATLSAAQKGTLWVNTAEDGEDENLQEVISYKYYITNKKPGTTWVTVTAKDEVKSMQRVELYFPDPAPQLNASAVTINKAQVYNGESVDNAIVDVLYNPDYLLYDIPAQDCDITLSGKNADLFTISYDANYRQATLTLKDSAQKNGKYTVELVVPIDLKADGKEGEYKEYKLKLTVNVVETAPAVTWKQTEKVNLFYTDEENRGAMQIGIAGLSADMLDYMVLEDYVDAKNPAKNAQCDYELIQDTENPGRFVIALKDGRDGSGKKGTLRWAVYGYQEKTAAFTVSTVKTKPGVVLSAKSDTLYLKMGYDVSYVEVKDKATGEILNLAGANWVKSKNELVSITGEGTEIKPKFNTYNVYLNRDVDPDSQEKGFLEFCFAEGQTGKKDTFEIQVWEENWSEPIKVSYSIKTDASTSPKLKLSSSTLVLNKNSTIGPSQEPLYDSQQAVAKLTLNGAAGSMFNDTWVTFTGKNEAANKILKRSLVLEYWGDRGQIVARLNDANAAPGTYQYTVWVEKDGYKASTTLKVQIVDKAPENCITVSKKGTIDVLQRETTSVMCTPKMNGLSGTITQAYLADEKDGRMFDSCFEDGKLVIKARGDQNYSTKYSYTVIPVFGIDVPDYGYYEVSGKPISFKVKQGKPKVTVSSANNTYYQQIGEGVTIKLEAVLNKQDIQIQDVYLVNYTEDLYLENWHIGSDSDGNEWDSCYEPYTRTILLNRYDYGHNPQSILKSGKKTLKFGIVYRDKAGNEQNTVVSYVVNFK